MSYDQWKTTDPRELEPEQEDEPTELDRVYDELCRAQDNAKYTAEVAAKRIAELTASLEEALEYFKKNYDVRDGDNGEQLPNEEMRLGLMTAETLYGIQF